MAGCNQRNDQARSWSTTCALPSHALKLERWATPISPLCHPIQADPLQNGPRILLTLKQAELRHTHKVWKFHSPRLQTAWTRRKRRAAGPQQIRSAGVGAESETDFRRPLKQSRPTQPFRADTPGRPRPSPACKDHWHLRGLRADCLANVAGSGLAAGELSVSSTNTSLQGLLPSRSNVAVRWRRNQATFVLIVLLRKLISCLQQLVSVPANPYLQGNYAPRAEIAPTQLKVEGIVPPELDGAYIRNGPNPVLPSTGKCNW